MEFGLRPSLPLSLSLAGLSGPGRETLRDQLEWARGLGFAGVQLNAAWHETRPRDLSRSARREVAALVRRSGLVLTGVELWIPPGHFTDPAHADRAASAVREAQEFAADMDSLCGPAGGARGGRGGSRREGGVVCLAFPEGREGDEVASLLGRDVSGAMIADHRWPVSDQEFGGVGVGLDPAAVILAEEDPARAVHTVAGRLLSARVSDLSASGRVPAGEGRVDIFSFAIALETSGYADGRHAVVDLRGLSDQHAGARTAVERLGG